MSAPRHSSRDSSTEEPSTSLHPHNRSGTAPCDIPAGTPQRGSFDTTKRSHGRQQGTGPSSSGRRGLGSSPADSSSSTGAAARHSSSSGNKRYGQWPPPGSSPASGAGPNRLGSSGSSGSSSGRMRQHSSGGSSSGRHGQRTFTWPNYMDHSELQRAMKLGRVFR